MRTNVQIELNDEERRRLADALDGKETKRLATRADVVAACRSFIEATLDAHDAEPVDEPPPCFVPKARPRWEDSPLLVKHAKLIEDKLASRPDLDPVSYRRAFANAKPSRT